MVTAAVDLTWDETTALTITAPSEVYIGGRMINLASGPSSSLAGPPEATDPLRQILVRHGSARAD